MKPAIEAKRRAQLVAGIGDEIGAHTVDAARLALIAKDEHEQPGSGSDRGGGDAEHAFDRHPFGIVDGAPSSGRDHLPDEVLHFRCPEPQLQDHAADDAAEGSLGAFVGVGDDALAVEGDHRIGHGVGQFGGGKSLQLRLAEGFRVGRMRRGPGRPGECREHHQQQCGNAGPNRRVAGDEHDDDGSDAGGQLPAGFAGTSAQSGEHR